MANKKEKSTRQSKKIVLDFSDLKDYQEREDMVKVTFESIFTDNYNSKTGAIKVLSEDKDIDAVTVYLKLKQMKSKDGNVGIRTYIVSGPQNYTLGEYKNKLSVSNLCGKIEQFAGVEGETAIEEEVIPEVVEEVVKTIPIPTDELEEIVLS